jgi:hypothetical protein
MDNTLFADGFEDCVIGYFRRCGQPSVIAYDAEKCIKKLVERDGMTHEEAIEHFEFNVVGAWVGNGTPAFVYKVSSRELNNMAEEGFL